MSFKKYCIDVYFEIFPQVAIKVCSKCGQQIGRGYDHKCSPGKKAQNIVKLANSTEVKEQVASSILKEKCSETDCDLTLKTKGTPLKIRMKPKPKIKPKLISHEDIDAFAMKTNSGAKKSKFIAQALRKVHGRGNVQPYYKETKARKRKEMADFFETRILNMTTKNGKATVNVDRVCLVVKNAPEHLEDIRIFRSIPVNSCHTKIGLDKGQGSLKITSNVMNKSSNVASTASNLFKKDLKYTGVKKLQILGMAELVNEDYSNVKKLGKNYLINKYRVRSDES